MKRTLLIWASMACMTVHSVTAQDAAVNKIIEIGQTDNQVMDHLDVLTNRIGGRVFVNKVAHWLDDNGGLAAMHERNKKKAARQSSGSLTVN